MDVSTAAVLRPLARPLLVTIVSAPLLVLLARGDAPWTLVRLVWVMGVYGVAAAALLVAVGVSAPERRRLLRALGRRSGRATE